jgi:hypothetical protein
MAFYGVFEAFNGVFGSCNGVFWALAVVLGLFE